MIRTTPLVDGSVIAIEDGEQPRGHWEAFHSAGYDDYEVEINHTQRLMRYRFRHTLGGWREGTPPR